MAEHTSPPEPASAAGLTRKEAVRRALEHLGPDATRVEIRSFVKQHFGYDMSPDHISSCKSDIQKEAGPVPASQPAAPRTEATPKPNGHASAKPLTKMDAVRKALAALGKDALPGPIQTFLKEQFNIEMTTESISKYKSNILSKKPAGAKTAKKPAAKQVEAKKVEPPKPPSAIRVETPAKANRSGITLSDIQTVQGLVGRLGTEQLQGLIDLLHR